ncbi:MAG: acyl-CoA thioesterase [Solirubrobacteraceae bacterium]|nr:acyl-CoA thioesterase [Solirubrobacteraceae bacterium]
MSGAEQADRRVLVFGDSFVAGVGDPDCRGWVGRVGAASWEAGIALTVHPLGVPRQTSVEVAARWIAEARPRCATGVDARVVFSFGANDATFEDGAARVAPAVSAATLERVLGEAAALGLATFVVGPPPVGDGSQDARIVALARRFAAVCEACETPFVDVAAACGADETWVAEAAAGDGTHPGAGGYAALAGLVLAGGWLDWLAR